MKNTLLVLALATALALPACGPGLRDRAFSYRFADNSEEQFREVLARLPPPAEHAAPLNALGTPMAFVTTHDEPRAVVALDLSTGAERWRRPLAAETRPEVLGDLVVTSDRTRVVALDLASGAERWQVRLGDLAFVGAARDGETVFLSSTVGALGGARRVGHAVAVDARTGEERWRHEIEGVFGQPAAAGGMVFIPWERQNIAVLDEMTGHELARLRSTDDVIAWIFQDPTGIYYGHRFIYRLTHRSVSGARADSTHIAPPLEGLPRDPPYFDDGFLPKPGTRTARGRIRVYFSPAPTAEPTELRLSGESYYFVYYRYVFAYDLDGTLRWTRILEEDVIGAQATEAGLVTAGEAGTFRLLGRESGNDAWTSATGLALASVDLDAAGLRGTSPAGAPRPLRESLSEIVLDPDNRLVDARAYAVGLLGTSADHEVTRDLLDLYAQRSMPSTVRDAIATALRGRRIGIEHVVEALGRRYDFIEDTAAPPLEVIVPSLLEAHATSAVPGLVHQMNDHETPIARLPEVVRAIVELGDASVVPALRRFLVLYHADSGFAEHPDALVAAAEGILRHGGAEGRTLLSEMSGDARTLGGLSAGILGFFEAERRAEEERLAREAADAAAAADEAARRAVASLPTRLSQEVINATFAEHADAIRECVAGEVARNPLLGQVRIVFILQGDGHADEVGVAPNTPELVACMQERVAAIAFPEFRERRMRAQFVISLRSGSGGAPVEDTASSSSRILEHEIAASAPWWTFWERRATATGAESTSPGARNWWDRRDPPPPLATGVGRGSSGGGASGGGASGGGASGGGASGGGASGGGAWWGGAGPADDTSEGGVGTEGGSAPADGGGPAWWGGTGAEDEATPPPAPPPPPPAETPRGRRGRRGREDAPAPPPAPAPPSTPPPAPAPPAAPPAPPAPAPAPPAAPPPPPAEEPPATPWWAPAEG